MEENTKSDGHPALALDARCSSCALGWGCAPSTADRVDLFVTGISSLLDTGLVDKITINTHTHIYIYNVMDNSECSNRWLSRHMHPFAVETTRFLLAGSSSGWFDLACPSHCTFSWTFALAIFVAGFGLGALLVLAWTFHFWTPSCSVPASRPVPVPSPSGRLVAYLHERARFSPDRGH